MKGFFYVCEYEKLWFKKKIKLTKKNIKKIDDKKIFTYQ